MFYFLKTMSLFCDFSPKTIKLIPCAVDSICPPLNSLIQKKEKKTQLPNFTKIPNPFH